MPRADESTSPATTTLPKGSPAREPPVHQPTVRTSSGTTRAPSGCRPTGTTGAEVPSGSTTVVGTNTAAAGSSRPTEAAGAESGAAGPRGGDEAPDAAGETPAQRAGDGRSEGAITGAGARERTGAPLAGSVPPAKPTTASTPATAS